MSTWKKVIPSEELLLSLFNRDFRKFPYHFSETCCQALWATFPRTYERSRIRVMSLFRQTVHGCDRCFFSSPLLSIFLHHQCSSTGESDLHPDRFHISFPFILLIRAFNSAGKQMTSFCYFTDKSGSTKPYSLKRASVI